MNMDPCYDGGDCCDSTCNKIKYPDRCGIALNSTFNLDTLGDRIWNCTDKVSPGDPRSTYIHRPGCFVHELMC